MTSDEINSFATNKRGEGLETPVRTFIERGSEKRVLKAFKDLLHKRHLKNT